MNGHSHVPPGKPEVARTASLGPRLTGPAGQQLGQRRGCHFLQAFELPGDAVRGVLYLGREADGTSR